MKSVNDIFEQVLIGVVVLAVVAAGGFGCSADPEFDDDGASEPPELRHSEAPYRDDVDGPHADHLTYANETLENRAAIEERFEGGVGRFERFEPFRQVGLRMVAESTDELSFRIRREHGADTEWKPVDVFFSEGRLHSGLVLLDEPAGTIELKGGEGYEHLHLDFFDEVVARDGLIRSDGPMYSPASSSDESDGVQSRPHLLAPSGLVTSRYEWGAVQPDKLCGTAHSPYRMAIHHTAAPSSDGGNAAQRMREMQSYHINVNGWCDIGYHFVVAQSGEIFQGRSRETRTGAHVGGHNTGNIGISLIGDYTSTYPPDTQLSSTAQIVHWTHETYSIALNRNSVKGHREHSGQWTNCPGNQGIAAIDEILAEAGAMESWDSSPPPEPDDPPPEPGGCEPTGTDDGDGSLFADFPDDAFGAEEAAMLYNAGITDGCSDSPLMFCPECPVTRQAMVTLLVRAAGLDITDPPAEPTFSDVSTDSPFYAEIEAAAEAGITEGCGDGKFCPGDQINRGATAALVRRAAGWPDEVASEAPTFSDVAEDHPFYADIETLYQRCVTDGYENGEFRPGNDVPRRTAAIFIARAFNLENNNPCAEPGGCTPQEAFDTDNSLFADFPTDSRGYTESTLLLEQEITEGCSQNPLMFCPRCTTSRAAMVTFLVRAAGLDVSNPPEDPTFDDVPADSTFHPYIEKAAEVGITNGCGDGVFCPFEPTTRQAAAAMIRRAAGWDTVEPETPSFDDVPPEHFFYSDIETLRDRCVTEGCRTGENFCPNREVSRSAAAIFIARAFNLADINPCAQDPDDGADPDDGDDPDDSDDSTDPDDSDDGSDSTASDPEDSADDNTASVNSNSACSSAPAGKTAPAIPGVVIALMVLGTIGRARREVV